MLPLRHGDDLVKRRGIIGRIIEKISGWIRLIVSDTNSRNLLGFLLLNLSFAFVELIYGTITNSLGLISDAFHMFFDCTGLLAGLVSRFQSEYSIWVNVNIFKDFFILLIAQKFLYFAQLAKQKLDQQVLLVVKGILSWN